MSIERPYEANIDVEMNSHGQLCHLLGIRLDSQSCSNTLGPSGRILRTCAFKACVAWSLARCCSPELELAGRTLPVRST